MQGVYRNAGGRRKYEYENHGYDEKELAHWKEFVQNHAHSIMGLERGKSKEDQRL